ncbi:cheW, purine-binding chemotaxis protein CheW [Nostoc flagelliforme CCNUN1]|uniref:CheW, purine-binding chemotaxis protein CheW n=1 Tax=Nostoc flagelliforme CCNUN1 TaxID=2038116 RepID=A0A2K8T1J1_9NOSO|nr:chemotaxis protein CheW [Nostoc flagelliforme]AUB41567.1 cheW, purine-binding chemotaxis protein CheW [Nostoc flagelliforme CCNUN1]
MAEQQICTFFLKGIYFGIDVQHVQEVIRPQATTPVPLAPPDIYGLINLRGQIITVIDLQRRLEMSEPQTQSTTKLVDEPDSRYVEKPTRNLTPQPPSLVGKGENSKPLSLQERGMEVRFPDPVKSQVDAAQGFNIIVCSDHEVVSLKVDYMGDVLEFAQNTFQPPPATLKGRMRQMLAGAYPLPEGFLLVLDAEKILDVNLTNQIIE